MSGEPWAPLEELAASRGAGILDSWARSSLLIRDNLDVDVLSSIAQRPGFTVQLLFDNADLPLTLDTGSPSSEELSALKGLLGNEREQAELSAVGDALEAQQLLHQYLGGAVVQYSEPAWIRSEEAFLAALEHNWAELANGFPQDAFRCGLKTIALEPIAGPQPPGGLPVAVAKAGQALSTRLEQALANLADAAAWTQVAVRSSVVRTQVFAALHHDQEPVIEIRLDSVAGGVGLLKWRMTDNQANREEALRHVLRFVTANAAVLPNARTVQTLAERQNIALARDRAAEVFRAITEGQRSTAALLENASESLSKLVEDTTTTASATIAAVIGVVALIVQNENLLPSWLILMATAVAVAGVVAVIASRWRRIQDQEDAVRRLRKRLDNDPLLPADDRKAMDEVIEDAKLDKRATAARQRIFALGAAASVVALAAAIWLVATPASSSKTSPSTTTTTRGHVASTGSLPSSKDPMSVSVATAYEVAAIVAQAPLSSARGSRMAR